MNIYFCTMYMRIAIVVFLSLMCFSFAQKQKDYTYMKKANKEYDNGNFENAEQQYAQLETQKSDFEIQFNKANAQLNQKKTAQAIETYKQSLRKAKTQTQASQAHYNIGNSYMQMQNYEKAIEAYKQAILQNPNDAQAKENYIIARKKLQQQKQQEKNQEKSDQKGNKAPDQKLNQDKQQKQQEKNNQGNQQEKNPSKDNKEGVGNQPKHNQNIKNQNNSSNGKSQDIDVQEYEGILEAMKQQEQKTFKKVINEKNKQNQQENEKNW